MPIWTIFPPIPKTVWYPGDPDVECLAGDLRDGALHVVARAEPAMRVADIPLGQGLYGVEFHLTLGHADEATFGPVANVQVTAGSGAILFAERTVNAEDLRAEFGGMYQGIRLDVVVEPPRLDVEFRVGVTSAAPIAVWGIKLVPRPGRIWFPDDLDPDLHYWRVNADHSATSLTPHVLCTSAVILTPGEYRAGVKLRPPRGVTTGAIAAIQASDVSDARVGSKVIAANNSITAQAMLAHFGIQDAKLRFRLAETCRVDLQVMPLAAGLTVQWFRLATAEEAVWHHYFNLGGNRSPLGEPVSALEITISGSSGVQGLYRLFERGLIVWTLVDGPCEISGEIARLYDAQGGVFGGLGFPTGRPVPSADRVVQHFEAGMLTASLRASG